MMNAFDNAQTQPILVVEDSPEDFEATCRALRKAGVANEIFHCECGDDALDYLFHRGVFADPQSAPRPGIILLDLNMPGTSGQEVLEAIKKAPDLRSIPVVVLTTSSDVRDIDRCYQLGANSYIQKPVDLPGYIQAIQRLRDYWYEIVILPRSE